MAVKEKKPPASDQTYKIIGSRPIRPDGVDKVTGKAIYAADVRVANRLYGAMVRSPHAHARIISIDTSKAEAIDGVKSVVTAADLPNVEDGLLWSSWKILARNKVLYDGHAIAAVAATSLAIAQEAADQIQIEYEVLPPVLDVLDAMADDPIIVLEDLRTTEMGAKLEGRTNVASHLQHSRGDINAGFAAADEVIEREFRTSTVHQGYIEPHSTVVLYNGDDHLTIWCSTQSAF